MPRKKNSSISDIILGTDFNNPFEDSDKPKRDSRRAFNRTQKNEILYQQDNKCAICHKKLDPRTTEFDHKKPWASGGRTTTINGRALHPRCHKIVTHNQRLRKTDKKRKSKQTDPFSLF
jgi:nitrate/TMAO reductase-like tetraheme cytochrome c subunit